MPMLPAINVSAFGSGTTCSDAHIAMGGLSGAPTVAAAVESAIKGELSASEDLTLCGHLEGSVRLPEHTLTIGANAEVKAEIVAKTVIILGSVTGNVTATERLDVRATGSVIGDVASPRLVIADGGTLRGKVQMTVGSTASHSNLRKVEAVG